MRAAVLALPVVLLLAAPAAPAAVQALAFAHFVDPLPGSAGETSIGVNPRTNSAFFVRFTHVDRVRWDAQDVPSWTDVTPALNHITTLDPIGYVDPVTGRVFDVQLQGETSEVTISDDDGVTWLPTQPPTAAPAFDHQTLGGGTWSIPALPITPFNPVYPNALYYCAQLALQECARSDDGGVTWGPPVPTNTLEGCAGLSGHVVAGPDGTVMVPDSHCHLGQGAEVSTDLGLTWTAVKVPGTSIADSDPSIAFDKAGTAWIAMSDAGHAKVSWSRDDGASWAEPVDVGADLGIQNTELPMMVAGDAGRAAMAFYGTTTPGDDQRSSFPGAWHLVVAQTVDDGATWQVVDTTPTDPVQVGCIWLGGGGNACRNLLDFQGATVDAEGRILVGYADGCTASRCGPNGGSSLGTIARQAGGPRLFAAFDP
ncbi:MAG: glycoside hydrolase [Halobacteriales archaeon]|nr:glycoside hydrolase [Halobacteriales archaeon]